jgi:hypothetical protein
MLRRLVVAAVWMLAAAGVVIAIGMRVRAYRLADPGQMMRQILPWVPDELAQHMTLIERTANGGLQLEIRAPAADIRQFAVNNHLEELTTPLYGTAPMQRWVYCDPKRPGLVVHLLLPSTGAPGLLTVTGVTP